MNFENARREVAVDVRREPRVAVAEHALDNMDGHPGLHQERRGVLNAMCSAEF